jgi:hypothetical protein
MLVIPSEVGNGASGTSDMDGCAARVAARESGDERVKSLDALRNEIENSELQSGFCCARKLALGLAFTLHVGTATPDESSRSSSERSRHQVQW